MTGSPTRTGRRSATSFVRWSSASRSLLIGFGSSSGLTRARQRHPNRAEICHIVQHVVKRQQMQWTKRGAHLLLQTRTRALDGTLRPLFEHWYPGLANDNETGANQAV